MTATLLAEGVYVVGYAYLGVPMGQARIRVQLSAAHTPAQLDRACAAFIRVGRSLGVLTARAGARCCGMDPPTVLECVLLTSRRRHRHVVQRCCSKTTGTESTVFPNDPGVYVGLRLQAHRLPEQQEMLAALMAKGQA